MKKTGATQKLIVFILLGLFSTLSLILLVFAFNSYNRIQQKSVENEKTRIALCYVANKIRTCDSADNVYLKRIDGINTLIIENDNKYNSDKDEGIFITYIYYYNGNLMECFSNSVLKPDLNIGEKIIELENFEMKEEKSGLITFKMTDSENNKHTLSICPRSGGALDE